ncbi:hypothetical protein A1F94_003348 [Pyrenophora tritici-repentis]|nr:hypothetical protein A1F94_003348 [Pyrenophora tritici-repentis]PZD04341.1 hypothetical protein A1F95_00713 [Pyrenophora tritici-repentis]PZD40467.1 hypothetical protein A1F97_05083 [Pyrenophora tritici-repentis]
MLLLDMIAADAASKHGLQPSPPRTVSPTSNASFFQMPMSILGSVLRAQCPSQSPATVTSTLSNPTKTNDLDASTPGKDSIKTAQHEAITALAPQRSLSWASDAESEKPRKRTPRSRTCYNLARPVHTRSKLHTRPKVLLQLHQIIASQRPRPAFEVIPCSLLPHGTTRRLARTFNTKEKLGPHDLLIAKAEAYNSQDSDEKSDDDRFGPRDVIGIISSKKCEKDLIETTEIFMDLGMSRWTVTQMPNGSYEFNSTDEHGLPLKARWVLKPANVRRTSSITKGSPPSPTASQAPDDRKFTFSTMSTNSRRHPIIATMTRNRIDVMDTYAVPTGTSAPTSTFASYTQSPTTESSYIEVDTFMDNLTAKLPIVTDDALRHFILISGVWVATREFTADPPSQSSTPVLGSNAIFRSPSVRTVSMSALECPRSPSPISTSDENRRSFPRMFRPSMEKLPRRASFKDIPASPTSAKPMTPAVPATKTRPSRANSTGTARHSLTGSLRKKHGVAFEDQTLVEERRIKPSVELLRIKELTLAAPIERPSVESTRFPLAVIPSNIVIAPSSEESGPPTPLLSSPFPSPSVVDTDRSRNTKSTFAPVTTTGLWDSGVTEGHGLKKRATSMFVLNEKKRKQEKKMGSERSRSKSSKTRDRDDSTEGMKIKRASHILRFKLRLRDLFRKNRA